jgi:hypothetical protein
MNAPILSSQAIDDLYALVLKKLLGKVTQEQHDAEVKRVAAEEIERTQGNVTVKFVKDGR